MAILLYATLNTRRFVLCLTLYCFVLVFFVLLALRSRANLSVFRTFVRFALVWFCLCPLPLGVWEGLRFVIVALPGLSLTFSASSFLYIDYSVVTVFSGH